MREIEQQMKTQSRLSYLLSQLIPTLGCLLLSCQHWEWQVENGISPSALLLYCISSLFFLLHFSDRLRAICLCAFMEVIGVRAEKNGEVAEGKVGKGVRVADMLIARDKTFFCSCYPRWGCDLSGLLIATFGQGVISLPQRAADTVQNISLMLAGQRHWKVWFWFSIGCMHMCGFLSTYASEEIHPWLQVCSAYYTAACMESQKPVSEDSLPHHEWVSRRYKVYMLRGPFAYLYLLRPVRTGVARIEDDVEVDSLFKHPLPSTLTAPLTPRVSHTIRSLQMKTHLTLS